MSTANNARQAILNSVVVSTSQLPLTGNATIEQDAAGNVFIIFYEGDEQAAGFSLGFGHDRITLCELGG